MQEERGVEEVSFLGAVRETDQDVHGIEPELILQKFSRLPDDYMRYYLSNLGLLSCRSTAITQITRPILSVCLTSSILAKTQ